MSFRVGSIRVVMGGNTGSTGATEGAAGQVTEGSLEEETSQLGAVDESKLVHWL